MQPQRHRGSNGMHNMQRSLRLPMFTIPTTSTGPQQESRVLAVVPAAAVVATATALGVGWLAVMLRLRLRLHLHLHLLLHVHLQLHLHLHMHLRVPNATNVISAQLCCIVAFVTCFIARSVALQHTRN